MCFAYVVREDRDLLELLDADYTFLNERLAKFYNFGITNMAENPFAITNVAGSAVSGLSATGVVAVLQDTDGDHIPDLWEIAYGLNPNDASDATADPDGDGFDNAQEFAASTDPTSAASALAIQSIAPSGNDLVVNFASVSGKSYRVQRCDDLAAGIWSTVIDVTATGDTTQATDPGGSTAAQRYYRVKLLP